MSAPSEPSEPRTEQVRVRRSPRILTFLLAGGILGAVVALILTFVFPENREYPVSQVFGFLLVLGIVVGAALGGIVALVFERSSQRRAREVAAVREVTQAPPAEPEEPEAEAAAEPIVEAPRPPEAPGPMAEAPRPSETSASDPAHPDDPDIATPGGVSSPRP
jgi:hypothetical protein